MSTEFEASTGSASLSPLGRVIAGVRHSPLAVVSMAWLALLVVSGLFASIIAPYAPLAQDLNNTNAGPTLHHLLGTDNLGRDVLSRLMYGSVPIVAGALLTTAVALAVGLPMGLAAGYFKRWVDGMTLWIADLTFALPSIVILLAVAVITNQNVWVLTVVFGLVASGIVVRIVRPIAHGVAELPYVDAARLSGLSARRLVTRHILPATLAPVIVIATQLMAVAIVVLASLSYLGLGGSPEQPTWGSMLAEASQNLTTDPWLLFPTGAVLVFTVLALTFIGSTVRDALWSGRPASLGSESETRGWTQDADALTRSIPGLSVVPPLLAVAELAVSFARGSQRTVVVDGVSLDVHRSEVRGLVGESGCGKTVTALSIPHVLPAGGRVVRGSIRLDGVELTTLSEKELAAIRGTRIGFISQQPLAALDPCFTVGSQLAEVIRVHTGCGGSDARQRAWAMFEEVGLADARSVARRFPHQVSGGMAQRVAIAIALAGEPDLLIADEPTTALDVTVQAGILDLLRDIVTRRSMGLLIVTHDLGVVADICDRVTVMYAGQIVEEGPTAAVLGHPTHPYTRGLLGSTPKLENNETLHAIEGTVIAPELWPVGCRFADRCPYALERCGAGPVDMAQVDGQHSRCVRASEVLVVGSRWVADG